MIDIARFLRLRPKGCASVVKESDCFYLVFKRFNPEEGCELEPERQLITATDLETRRDQLQPELDAIAAILAEMRGLDA